MRAFRLPWSPGFVLGLRSRGSFLKWSKLPWNMIHSMSCRKPCRLYIHLASTYFVDCSTVVWSSELGPAPPSPLMRVLVEVYWLWTLNLVCEVALKWPPRPKPRVLPLLPLFIKHTLCNMEWIVTHNYTKYSIQCHRVFYVIVVTFMLTILMNKCTKLSWMMDDKFEFICRPKPYLLLCAHSSMGCAIFTLTIPPFTAGL